MRQLRDERHILSEIGIGTMLFGGFLKKPQRVTRPACNGSAKGVAGGGILTRHEMIAELEEKTRKEQKEEAAKVTRWAEREARNGGARRLQGPMRVRESLMHVIES